MTRTITAIYDSETDARLAREQLLGRGVDDDDVRIVSHGLSRTEASAEEKGLWESIKDFFVGEDDQPMYSEGLRRGGYLLTARVDDTTSDEAIEILEQSNAVDMDQRSEQWRSEGWMDTTPPSSMSGYAAGAGPTTETVRAQFADAPGNTTSSEGLRSTDEQSIPVLEERLRVGKREVNRGAVRVRSYVVEEPVHEQVALREEHVQIERRPVSGTSRLDAGDAADFKERTIEVTERAEEPVIAKDAVVKEEVVVRKTADERTESIDDSVRRTEVEVDDTTSKVGSKSARATRKRT